MYRERLVVWSSDPLGFGAFSSIGLLAFLAFLKTRRQLDLEVVFLTPCLQAMLQLATSLSPNWAPLSGTVVVRKIWLHTASRHPPARVSSSFEEPPSAAATAPNSAPASLPRLWNTGSGALEASSLSDWGVSWKAQGKSRYRCWCSSREGLHRQEPRRGSLQHPASPRT